MVLRIDRPIVTGYVMLSLNGREQDPRAIGVGHVQHHGLNTLPDVMAKCASRLCRKPGTVAGTLISQKKIFTTWRPTSARAKDYW